MGAPIEPKAYVHPARAGWIILKARCSKMQDALVTIEVLHFLSRGLPISLGR